MRKSLFFVGIWLFALASPLLDSMSFNLTDFVSFNFWPSDADECFAHEQSA